MSAFDEYLAEHFKVNREGNVCHIRRGAFNGNGLLELIGIDDLEDLWDAAVASVARSSDGEK